MAICQPQNKPNYFGNGYWSFSDESIHTFNLDTNYFNSFICRNTWTAVQVNEMNQIVWTCQWNDAKSALFDQKYGKISVRQMTFNEGKSSIESTSY